MRDTHMKDTHYVICEGAAMLSVPYTCFNEAMTEAQRLAELPANKGKGVEFHVLGSVGHTKSSEEDKGMKRRQAIYKDCQKCDEPPNCGVAPERCNILVEPEPVIEVRDVVRHNHTECIETDCTVGYMGNSDEKCWLENEMGCNNCIVSTDKLTLIRKGPKTITFEGVKWSIATLKDAPELKRSSPFIGDQNMKHFAQFEFDNERYIMTLTKEERNG